MAYYSRSSWTNAPKGGRVLAGTGRIMTTIYIHYPGQPGAIGRASLASTRNRLEGYRRQHKNVQGWADLAYNIAVDQNGNVWEGRGIDRTSGANGGTASNQHGQAILVLVGNNEQPTADCIAGIKDAVRRIRARHPRATRMRGHQQSPDASTACPGVHLMRLVRNGGLEPGSSTPAPSTPAPSTPVFNDVDWTQQTLVDLGFDPGPVDGKYGSKTEAATRAYQADFMGIANGDGRPGPATRKHMEETMSKLDRLEAIVTQNQKRIDRVWAHRGVDYVNAKAPSTKDHQVARAHEYSWKVWQRIRLNAWRDWLRKGIWSLRSIDYVNPESPSTKDHQIARAHEYSFEGLKETRAIRVALEAMAGAEGKDVYEAVAKALEDHDKRQVQVEVTVADAPNAKTDDDSDLVMAGDTEDDEG